MQKLFLSSLALGALLLGVGCGEDGRTPVMDGSTLDGGAMDATAMDATPDVPVTVGDGNDSFAEAEALVAGTAAMGAIQEPDDRDYFSFTGTAGDWILLATAANPDDSLDMLDTVITLYDSSMTRVAENDDRQPRVNTDSELVTRLPADGTYYVEVQEFSAWAGEPAEGLPSFTYELTMAQLSELLAGITMDPEGGDDLASAAPLRMSSGFSVVLGDLRDAADIDVYSLSIPVGMRLGFGVWAHQGGDTGNGATSEPMRVWVTSADGATVIAEVAPAALRELQPSLGEGDYLLWVEHGGTAGANDFYVLSTNTFGDNPPETMDATNFDAAGAEPISIDATSRRGFVLATLPDGDTDVFRIDALAGESLGVYCSSRSSGSGVIDLQARVTSADGLTELRTGVEVPTTGLSLADIPLSGPASYLIWFTKGSQDPAVAGDWVRCGFALSVAP